MSWLAEHDVVGTWQTNGRTVPVELRQEAVVVLRPQFLLDAILVGYNSEFWSFVEEFQYGSLLDWPTSS